MAKMGPIAIHPLPGLPYDKLLFVRLSANRTPYYQVFGSNAAPCGAFKALGHAFQLYGGVCYYCQRKFKPHPLSRSRAHRDHVVPRSSGGSDRLHNLVIACKKCGSEKADKPLRAFQPKLADHYLCALETHIAKALGAN